MSNEITNYNLNILLSMILSHFITDFVLQSDKMVMEKNSKSWKSAYLLLHILITFLTALFFTRNLIFSIFVSIFHYFIDILKVELTNKKKWNEIKRLTFDQFLHILSILISWYFITFYNINFGIDLANKLMRNNHFILYLLSYILVVFPYSYVVKMSTIPFFTKEMDTNTVSNAGKYIGIFERILIITFIYLGELSSIGFLIAAKSILRFTDNDKKQTEYVLIGSLISYVLAIITAIIIRQIVAIV